MKSRATLATRLLNRIGVYSRRQLREAAANFSAAAINRLTASWTQTTLSPDAQSRTDLRILRARSRELRDNNLYAKRFLGTLKKNVLGEYGINLRCKIKEPDRVEGGKLIPGRPDIFANKLIEEEWYRWGRREFCTMSGKLNWCDVERITMDAVATDGEVLFRKIRTKTRDNPYGFSLQPLESDFLDDDYDTINPETGNEVRMGIEVDKWDRVVAYHLLTYNPNDTFMRRRPEMKRYRLLADEVIHLGLFRRFGQTRCIPWMASAAYQLNMIGKYSEAEVTAARAAACKMGFFKRTSGSASYDGEEDGSGNKMMESEPGVWEELPQGLEPHVVDWNHPNSSYGVFMKTILREIASGLDISYNTLANDMESVNFASGKLGLDDERDIAKALQNWLIENLHEVVFKEWLQMAITSGKIPLPMAKFDKFNVPAFKGRRWSYVNPQQEVAADVAALRNGLTSHSRILAERNIDRDELFDEIADDKAAAEARGITISELEAEALLNPEVPPRDEEK